jgi:hypothetical protein
MDEVSYARSRQLPAAGTLVEQYRYASRSTECPPTSCGSYGSHAASAPMRGGASFRLLHRQPTAFGGLGCFINAEHSGGWQGPNTGGASGGSGTAVKVKEEEKEEEGSLSKLRPLSTSADRGAAARRLPRDLYSHGDLIQDHLSTTPARRHRAVSDGTTACCSGSLTTDTGLPC